jgi:hypothetical protein
MNYDDLCRFQQVKSEGNRSKGLGEGDVDIGIAVVAVVGSRCGTVPSQGSNLGGKTTIKQR